MELNSDSGAEKYNTWNEKLSRGFNSILEQAEESVSERKSIEMIQPEG